MKISEQDEARYTRHGYKDRGDYLNNLAEDHGVEPFAVNMMADILGDSEDFDGLVTELEDMDYSGLLDGFRTETKSGDDNRE